MSRWLKGALQKKQSHKNKIENKMQAPGHGPGWGSVGRPYLSPPGQTRGLLHTLASAAASLLLWGPAHLPPPSGPCNLPHVLTRPLLPTLGPSLCPHYFWSSGHKHLPLAHL